MERSLIMKFNEKPGASLPQEAPLRAFDLAYGRIDCFYGAPGGKQTLAAT